MLVHKKQEWLYGYEEQAVLPVPRPDPGTPEKADKNEINKPLRSKCLTLVLTVAFLAAVVTVQSAYIVKSGYGLVDAKQEIMRLERANETLKLDIAKLKTPERVAQIASQKLGMIVPKNAYFSAGTGAYATKGLLEAPAADKDSLTGLLNISLLDNLWSGQKQ